MTQTVAAAQKEWDDATHALANATREFLDTNEDDILHCMEMYHGVREDIHQLRALIGARNRKESRYMELARQPLHRKVEGSTEPTTPPTQGKTAHCQR